MVRARSTSWIALLLGCSLALLPSGSAGQKRVQYQQVVDQAVPSVYLYPPSSAISYGTPLIFTAVLIGKGSPPTGIVTFWSGSTNLGDSSLNAAGQATYTAANLPAGQDIITASYVGDTNYFPAVSSPVTISVAGLPPSINVIPSASTVTTAQAITITVTVNGGAGHPAPTGTVQLTGGNYSSPIVPLSAGNATFVVSAGSLAVGTDKLTVNYIPDAAASSMYGSVSNSSQVTVVQVIPGFTISAAPLTLQPGATSSNTSIITITPTGGFSGVVALAAGITSAPANAQNLPALSFQTTGFVTVGNALPGTAVLTVTTTAPVSGVASGSRRPILPGVAAGGAAFACIFLVIVPFNRRGWRNMLGALVLYALFVCGMNGCTIVATQSTTAQATNTGTTPGTYTITITGASGSTSSTGSFTLTVQ
jgi:hypothetical protein